MANPVTIPTLSDEYLTSFVVAAIRRQAGHHFIGSTFENRACELAYRAGCIDGANAELEACVEELKGRCSYLAEQLQAARRPRSISPREKAEKALARIEREVGKGGNIHDGSPFDELRDLIRGLPDA